MPRHYTENDKQMIDQMIQEGLATTKHEVTSTTEKVSVIETSLSETTSVVNGMTNQLNSVTDKTNLLETETNELINKVDTLQGEVTSGVGDLSNKLGTLSDLGTVPQSVTKTLVDREINIRDFGAVGNDAVKDTAAIQAAVTYAKTNNVKVRFPNGTFVVNANITDWNSVMKVGEGKVKFGTKIFTIEPKASDTNTLYVGGANASDANMGIEPTVSFATLRKAFDVLKDRKEVLQGNWKIQMQAGTYLPGTYTTSILCVNRLHIIGELDVNGEPATIIDGSLDTSKTYGILFDGRTYVKVENIHIKNVRNGDSLSYTGITSQKFADLYTANCRFTNCGAGVFPNSQGYYLDEKSVFDGCYIGAYIYSGITYYIGYRSTNAASSTVFKNCLSSGLATFHQVQGHIDYTTITGNGIGIDIKNSSRVHAKQCQVNGNGVGVYVVTGSTWMNDGTTVTNNTKNIRYGTGGTELSFRDLKSPLFRAVDGVVVNHTGTTNATTVKSVAIPANALDAGNLLRIKVFGKYNLTAGNTCAITCYVGNENIFGSTSGSASTNNFSAEWDIILRSPTEIATHRRIMDGNTITSNNITESTSVNFAATTNIDIKFTLTSATDSVEIKGFIVEQVYG